MRERPDFTELATLGLMLGTLLFWVMILYPLFA